LRCSPEIAAAYFYFDHSIKDQTAENVIRSLLVQLVRRSPKTPEDVLNEYKKRNDRTLKMEDYARLVIQCTKEFSKLFGSGRVFLLLDAYDEFLYDPALHDQGNSLPALHDQRKKFIACLQEFSQAGAKVLTTTRSQYRSEIAETLQTPNILEIIPEPADVERFLRIQLQRDKFSEDLKKEIQKALLTEYERKKW
jgi:hypothetical protein